MTSFAKYFIVLPAIFAVSCGKADTSDIEGSKSEAVSAAQNGVTSEKDVAPKTKPAAEPVPVDVAVERALKKMDPAQKERLNKTPLTKGRYPSPPEPNFGPEAGSLQFTDTDSGATIGGILTMNPAIDENGDRVDETANGITGYLIHWGLEVGAPGTADDKGNGDLGGDCMNFRDSNYVGKISSSAATEVLRWEIPAGTAVPEDAIYFVGLTEYGSVFNLKKCIQIPIKNLIEQ